MLSQKVFIHRVKADYLRYESCAWMVGILINTLLRAYFIQLRFHLAASNILASL
jgi:hypothetical protein